MRLAIITSSFPPYLSGVAVNALQIASGMSSRGHDVRAFIPSYPIEGDRVPSQSSYLRFVHLPSVPNPLKKGHMIFIPDPFAIYRGLGAHRPDIIHLQDPQFFLFPSVVYYARRCHIPIIHAHHFPPEFVTSQFPRWIGKIITPAVALAPVLTLYGFVDRIVTPTGYMRGVLRSHGLHNPIEVISNGVDTDRYLPPVHKYDQGDDMPIVLYLGRLDPDKNIPTLIRAAQYLRSRCRIWICGTGKCESSLRNLASSLHTSVPIEFRGPIAQKQAIEAYQRARVFVLPGKAEAQSIASLEAASCGLPLVLARSGALPELIRQDKPNGLLFDPDDPHDLAHQVDMIVEDPRRAQEMGRYSRELALRHRLSVTLDQYEKLYRSLIDHTV